RLGRGRSGRFVPRAPPAPGCDGVSVATGSMPEALGSLVGAINVVPDPPVILDGVRPRWLVAPASVEELAAVVALAADASLVVCPLGSGSALELGFPLHELDVAVDLRRLDTVLEYNPDDLTVSVHAGVELNGLDRLLLARRAVLPLRPPGRPPPHL